MFPPPLKNRTRLTAQWIILLTIVASFALQPINPDQPILNFENGHEFKAVGEIYGTKDGKTARGIATLMGEKGIITAKHVLEGIENPIFVCEGKAYPLINITFCSQGLDFAWANLTKPVKGVKPLDFAKGAPDPGKAIMLVTREQNAKGKPNAQVAHLPVTILNPEGIISEVHNPLGSFTFTLTSNTETFANAKIEQGDSGSPIIVYQEGEPKVVGVVSAFQTPEAWEIGILQRVFIVPTWKGVVWEPKAPIHQSPFNPIQAKVSAIAILALYLWVLIHRRKNKGKTLSPETPAG